MLQVMLCVAVIVGHANLFSAEPNYHHLQKGYKLLGQHVYEIRDLPECSIGHQIIEPHDVDENGCVKVLKRYWKVQIPTYKETDGSLVQDRSKWVLNVLHPDVYNQVVTMLSGVITRDTIFPIRIDTSDRYIHPIERGSVEAGVPQLRYISLSEKIKKDQQAAYALLSWQNKMRYSIFGGNLADPYEADPYENDTEK